jgi:acyl-CoA thioesterase FadM
MITWRFRTKLGFFEEGYTPFRVMLTDLDTNRHMNNGVFLSVMDVARIDLVFRSGLAKTMKSKGWYPVVASQTIRYRRSLAPFEKFQVKSRLLGWDEKFVYLQQTFLSKQGVVALALVKGRFLKKTGGGVAPAEIAQAMGISQASPKLAGWIEGWTRSEDLSWSELGVAGKS